MGFFRRSSADMWVRELSGSHGQWILLYLRGAALAALPNSSPMPGPIPLAGRIISIDHGMVRCAQMGNVLIVPLANIWYVLKPSVEQQEALTLSAMSFAGTK